MRYGAIVGLRLGHTWSLILVGYNNFINVSLGNKSSKAVWTKQYIKHSEIWLNVFKTANLSKFYVHNFIFYSIQYKEIHFVSYFWTPIRIPQVYEILW